MARNYEKSFRTKVWLLSGVVASLIVVVALMNVNPQQLGGRLEWNLPPVISEPPNPEACQECEEVTNDAYCDCYRDAWNEAQICLQEVETEQEKNVCVKSLKNIWDKCDARYSKEVISCESYPGCSVETQDLTAC